MVKRHMLVANVRKKLIYVAMTRLDTYIMESDITDNLFSLLSQKR